MKITREELIQICKDAVIHHTKWMDRDSFCAQKSIQSIYKALTAGLKYKINSETTDTTIWIDFIQPINLKQLEKGKHLQISSRENYFKDCDPDYDTEMFDSDGIDFSSGHTSSYMPTRRILDLYGIGNDWY